MSTHWDETGALIIQGRLTPEQGEVFLEALAKVTEQRPWRQKCRMNAFPRERQTTPLRVHQKTFPRERACTWQRYVVERTPDGGFRFIKPGGR